MPRFDLTQEKREDPEQRARVGQIAHQMGIPLAQEDFLDQIGFRKVKPGEPVIEGGSAMPGGPVPGGFPFVSQPPRWWGSEPRVKFSAESYEATKAELASEFKALGKDAAKAKSAISRQVQRFQAAWSKAVDRVQAITEKALEGKPDGASERVADRLATLQESHEDRRGDSYGTIEDAAAELGSELSERYDELAGRASEDLSDEDWEAIEPDGLSDSIDQIANTTRLLDRIDKQGSAALEKHAEKAQAAVDDWVDLETETAKEEAEDAQGDSEKEEGPGVTREDDGKFAPGGKGNEEVRDLR